MVELEIQTLSESREGLLIDVGRSVTESGFILQRQRLAQDINGVLLTMVVRGPARKQRTLEAALDAHERIISFDISTFVEGEPKPHFAASRAIVSNGVAPPPAAMVEAAPAAAPTAPAPAAARPDAPAVAGAIVSAVVSNEAEAPAEAPTEPPLEPGFDFILAPPAPPAPAPEPAPVESAPFVERVALEPDMPAVEKALQGLADDYPVIVPRLRALERAVVEAARESSLSLAGQRTGTWVFERDYAPEARLDLHEAIARIGVPALGALVEVEQQGEQVHIRNSPLCTAEGHSGCGFFSGFLEGLLGPALASDDLSIFAVCCRSYGADDCVLALSD